MNHYLHLQEAIEWIEKHLQEELSMAEIASKSCFSTFHFQRLFQAISGFTVLEYIRRRRLSEAAKKLKDTELRILEVAILFQYGSQEAFTRAFTGYFGMTPAKFRREKEELKTGQQSKINFLQYPNNLKGNVNMYKPQIVELDEITIVGYPYQTTLNDDHYFEDKKEGDNSGDRDVGYR